MWGIRTKRAKKMIMDTTQNAVRDVAMHLTKQFRTRQEMFWWQRFCGTKYMDTMIAGMKSASGNRLAQVYVTNLGDIRINPLPHKKDSHTPLSRYFVDSGVKEHPHRDNACKMTNHSKWKNILDKEGGINILQTDSHSPFKKNDNREIKQLQRLKTDKIIRRSPPVMGQANFLSWWDSFTHGPARKYLTWGEATKRFDIIKHHRNLRICPVSFI